MVQSLSSLFPCLGGKSHPRAMRLGAAVVGTLLSLTPLSLFGQLNPRWDTLNDPGVLGVSTGIAISPHDRNTMMIGGDMMGLARSTNAGVSWERGTGLSVFEIDQFTFHPTDTNTVWVGTLGGPYKSTNKGLTWAKKRTGLPTESSSTYTAPIHRVCFDPNNSNTLVAFGGNRHYQNHGTTGGTQWGAVWKSTNSGDNWKWIALIGDADVPPTGDITGVKITDAFFASGSSSILYACSPQGGVYKSTNSGINWAKVNGTLPLNGSKVEAWAIANHPAAASTLLVGLHHSQSTDIGKVWKTTNAGAGWYEWSNGIVANDPTATAFNNIAYSESVPANVYCSAGRSITGTANRHVTYRSTNLGANWERIIFDGQKSNIDGGTGSYTEVTMTSLSVDPNDPLHLAATCWGYALRSTNGGTNWRDITSFGDSTSHPYTRRGNGFSGQVGQVIAWNPYKHGQVFTLGMDSGKLLRTEDSFWNFKLIDRITGDGGVKAYNGGNGVTFCSNGTIYLAPGQGDNNDDSTGFEEKIIKSTDYGANWSYTNWPENASGMNKAVYAHYNNANNLWAIIGNSFYRSTNGGSNWFDAITLAGAGELHNIAAHSSSPNTIYVAAQAGIYKSTNGTSFSLLSGSPGLAGNTGFHNQVTIDPTNTTRVFGTTFREGSQGVYLSTNSGSNWKVLTQAIHENARALAIDPYNNQRMAFVTDYYPGRDTHSNIANSGVWISTNGGTNWGGPYTNGIGVLRGDAIAFNPDKSSQLIVGLAGGGFQVTDLGTSTSFVSPTQPPHYETIQAEDYDNGGPDVGYHDSDTNNTGNDLTYHGITYADIRTVGTDAITNDSKRVVTAMVTGEWLKYKVNITEDGLYSVTVRASSTGTTGKFHLEANGVNVTGPISIPNTGSMDTFVNVPASARLIAGTQYVKVVVDGDGADLDYVQFGPITGLWSSTEGLAEHRTYKVRTAALNMAAYTDRTYTVNSLSANLTGLPIIIPPNDDKAITVTDHLDFVLDKPATVYVFLDNRITTMPDWITNGGWTSQSSATYTFGCNWGGGDSPRKVYSKHFSAGLVELGGPKEFPHAGGDIMYHAIIKFD